MNFTELKNSLLKENTPKSMYDIAQLYDSVNQFGDPNPYLNNFKRLYWYLKSAINGYGEGYNNLAYIIEHELKVKSKIYRALEYYRKASESGSDLGKENYELTKLQLKKRQR